MGYPFTQFGKLESVLTDHKHGRPKWHSRSRTHELDPWSRLECTEHQWTGPSRRAVPSKVLSCAVYADTARVHGWPVGQHTLPVCHRATQIYYRTISATLLSAKFTEISKSYSRKLNSIVLDLTTDNVAITSASPGCFYLLLLCSV